MANYEVFKDKTGEWRWRLVANNGEVVAQSEAYTTKESALRGAETAAAVSEMARQEASDHNGAEEG